MLLLDLLEECFRFPALDCLGLKVLLQPHGCHRSSLVWSIRGLCEYGFDGLVDRFCGHRIPHGSIQSELFGSGFLRLLHVLVIASALLGLRRGRLTQLESLSHLVDNVVL